MSLKLFRVYNQIDVKEIKAHLMIYGDLGAQCAHCQSMDIKLEAENCPKCKTEFQYVSFRNIRSHLPKIFKLMEQRPSIKIIDFDDYKRNEGASKAEEFLK